MIQSFYEHKRLYRLLKDEVPADDYIVPIDKANVVRTGSDLTVISYGMTCISFSCGGKTSR